jgi:hypothetical protein
MANSYSHALSSHNKWGGDFKEHLEIHKILDMSKAACADTRHRMFLHHSPGIGLIKLFAKHSLKSTSVELAEDIAKLHIWEDHQEIPSINDWLKTSAFKSDIHPQYAIDKINNIHSKFKLYPQEIKDLQEILNVTSKSQPQCLFHSLTPFLIERIYNKEIIGEYNTPIRIVIEDIVKQQNGKIVSFSDTCKGEVEDWMYKKALQLHGNVNGSY